MEDFRNFFSPSKEKGYFSLYHATISVYNLLRSEYIKRGIDFEIENNEAIKAYGYNGEFKQAVLNILNNARDVFIERDIKKARVKVEIAMQGDQACIRFLDNGGGIAPHLLPCKIFEHFNSTKGEKGMGIGLTLAHMIVHEKMGGSLKAYNNLEGAVFEIILPTIPPMGEARDQNRTNL
ncbi:MAG: sensor histidine kinase [Wolinella sp.]